MMASRMDDHRWVALVVIVLAGWVPSVSGKEGGVTIRPAWDKSMSLRYTWDLVEKTAWTPPIDDQSDVTLKARMDFTLDLKTPRPDGSATFDLLFNALEAETTGKRGGAAIVDDGKRTRLRLRHEWVTLKDRGPLSKPMTLTLGPRFDFRFGTGLGRIAMFVKPGIDPRLWYHLTRAPEQPVSPGDKWEHAFRLPVPGARGEPLEGKLAVEVQPWRKYGRLRVLPIAMKVRLDLADSNIIWRDGNQAHVRRGALEARGEAWWEPERGILCRAVAEQRFDLQVDRPEARRLQSRATSELELVDARR